jgi:hypothetical protein
MVISTTIGLLPLLSACASPTHGIFVEHHSTSPYRSTGTGAYLHRRLTPDIAIFVDHATMTMKRRTGLSLSWSVRDLHKG